MLLGVGFGLGLMHALDADHVLAMSTLNNKSVSPRKVMASCLHWSLGHGAVLLLSGALLFGIGYSVPEAATAFFEYAVGIFLIVIGLYVLWGMHKEKLILSHHKHGELAHTHWHKSGDVDSEGHAVEVEGRLQSQHAPMLVGVIHGLAGSAPALAIIPALAKGEMVSAMTYVAIFSIGVTLSMMTFGLSWGYFQAKLQQSKYNLYRISRHLVASSSIALGVYWIAN